jgi:hypothetical protein
MSFNLTKKTEAIATFGLMAAAARWKTIKKYLTTT